MGVSGAAAAALAAALFGIRAANAFFTAFFGTGKIPDDTCCNGNQYENYNDIFHKS